MPPFPFRYTALLDLCAVSKPRLAPLRLLGGGPSPRRSVLLIALVAALLTLSSSAWGACPEQTEWANRCRTDSFSFEVQSCPRGVIIGSARLNGGEALLIELKDATASSFRRVGDTGVQPLGEFPDWNKESVGRRETLEAMLECVKRAGPPPLPTTVARATASESPRLVVLGLLLLGIALFLRFNLADKSARNLILRDTALILTFALGVAWLRWHLVPPATFHQNGQGPLWIRMAIGSAGAMSNYGPGYAEVFSWLATRMDPETAVFGIQSGLYALMIPAAFAIVRIAGLSRSMAWLAALGVAVHPLAARLAGGESYFATISALAMLACLAMVAAAQPQHTLKAAQRRWIFLCGILSAGALIAQAARVHPIGWTPLALLAIAPLGLAGPLRRRLVRATIISGGIACLVLGTSSLEMLRVLSGELGQQWLPRVRFSVSLARPAFLVCLLLLLVAWQKRAWLPGLAFCGVLGIALGNNPLLAASPLIRHAVYWLYLPALVATFAGWLAQLGSLRRSVAGACAIGLAVGWGWEWRASYLTLPTDALEIRAANAWKRQLPEGALVAYVDRVDQRVLFLPLYGSRGVRAARLASDQPTVMGSSELYYYRSSLCSTPHGKIECDRVESSMKLEPIFRQTLPAVASLPYLPLGTEPIEVALFKARVGPTH